MTKLIPILLLLGCNGCTIISYDRVQRESNALHTNSVSPRSSLMPATQSFQSAAAADLAPAPRTVMLSWDYPAHGSEISFNVYGTEDLSRSMQALTNVSEQRVAVPMDAPQMFYSVRASNAVNRLESQ